MKKKLIPVLAIALAVTAALAAATPGQASAPPPPQEPQVPDSEFLIPPPEPLGTPLYPGGPTDTQTSEFMAGTVVYSVIFVESNGGTGKCSPADSQSENWSSDRQATVLSRITEGLAFWTSRPNRPDPLRFIVDDQGRRPTSCEPITRSSDDEGLWIADTLTALGFQATKEDYFSVARRFAHSRRTALMADWGFVIFVVDSLNDVDGKFSNGKRAYAYLNGPFMVMTYDNGDWGIDRMNLVVAHETGHIFGALDEYAKYTDGTPACSTSDSWGYLNARNTSCNNGGDTSDISIMGEASDLTNPAVDVSASARAAIGWRNPAAGAGPGAVVDVVRTASVSLTEFYPDPTSETTPTYSATANHIAFPPEGPRRVRGVGYGTASPVTISKVAAAEWNVDGGAWSRTGVVPQDGAFDEESDPYAFTPPTPVSPGMRMFGTRSFNNFGHISSPAYDTLYVTGGGGGGGGGCRPPKCVPW